MTEPTNDARLAELLTALRQARAERDALRSELDGYENAKTDTGVKLLNVTLNGGFADLTVGQIADLPGENKKLRAERDALAAENARLRADCGEMPM